jgi:VWFA-related protein
MPKVGALVFVASMIAVLVPRAANLANSASVPPGYDSKQITPGEEKNQAIKFRVGEVIVPVTVVDRVGDVVWNLTDKDFRLYDNGIEQKIDHFDFGGDPASIVLVVETSSHVEALLPAVRRTGIIFTQAVMTTRGEAAVMRFDNTVDLLEQFTPDQDGVERTIDQLGTGTSGSKLYDAMSQGVSLLDAQPASRRRVLVVVAEAQDRGSKTKLGDVVREAQLANVTIDSIGLSTTSAELRAEPKQFLSPQIGPTGTYPAPTPYGFQTPQFAQGVQGNMNLLAIAEWLVRAGTRPNTLAVASGATGGLHVSTIKGRSIEQAMDQIGGELSSQYVLGYSPSENETPGYHEIKVDVNRRDVVVRTRPGYYLAPSR